MIEPAEAVRVCPRHGVPLVVTPDDLLVCPVRRHTINAWLVVLHGEVVAEASRGGPLAPPGAGLLTRRAR